jgi:predicted MPP superfamily phosphohydrolase
VGALRRDGPVPYSRRDLRLSAAGIAHMFACVLRRVVRANRYNRGQLTFLAFVLLVLTVGWVAYQSAVASPVTRQLVLKVPGHERHQSVRLVLFSDVHAHGPDMPPKRVAALVKLINRLQPDIILAAGDFVGNHWIGRSYSPEDAIKPLRGLKARLGRYAVLGNNDVRLGAAPISNALRSAGFRLLSDEALAVGPLALGGLSPRSDWNTTDMARRRTFAAMNQLPGLKVLLAHEPDHFPYVPGEVALTLAGHTHCGQIAVPVLGPVLTGSDYGRRYGCGIIREGPVMFRCA